MKPKPPAKPELPSVKIARDAAIETAIDRLISSILDLRTDVLGWTSLAKRQLKEIPDCDHLPCGPTDAGVRYSQRILNRAVKAIADYRSLTE